MCLRSSSHPTCCEVYGYSSPSPRRLARARAGDTTCATASVVAHPTHTTTHILTGRRLRLPGGPRQRAQRWKAESESTARFRNLASTLQIENKGMHLRRKTGQISAIGSQGLGLGYKANELSQMVSSSPSRFHGTKAKTEGLDKKGV